MKCKKYTLKKMLLVSRAHGWMPYHMSTFIDISTEHKRGLVAGTCQMHLLQGLVPATSRTHNSH